MNAAIHALEMAAAIALAERSEAARRAEPLGFSKADACARLNATLRDHYTPSELRRITIAAEGRAMVARLDGRPVARNYF